MAIQGAPQQPKPSSHSIPATCGFDCTWKQEKKGRLVSAERGVPVSWRSAERLALRRRRLGIIKPCNYQATEQGPSADRHPETMKMPEVTPLPNSPSPLPSPQGRGKRGRGKSVRGIFKAEQDAWEWLRSGTVRICVGFVSNRLTTGSELLVGGG